MNDMNMNNQVEKILSPIEEFEVELKEIKEDRNMTAEQKAEETEDLVTNYVKDCADVYEYLDEYVYLGNCDSADTLNRELYSVPHVELTEGSGFIQVEHKGGKEYLSYKSRGYDIFDLPSMYGESFRVEEFDDEYGRLLEEVDQAKKTGVVEEIEEAEGSLNTFYDQTGLDKNDLGKDYIIVLGDSSWECIGQGGHIYEVEAGCILYSLHKYLEISIEVYACDFEDGEKYRLT